MSHIPVTQGLRSLDSGVHTLRATTTTTGETAMTTTNFKRSARKAHEAATANGWDVQLGCTSWAQTLTFTRTDRAELDELIAAELGDKAPEYRAKEAARTMNPDGVTASFMPDTGAFVSAARTHESYSWPQSIDSITELLAQLAQPTQLRARAAARTEKAEQQDTRKRNAQQLESNYRGSVEYAENQYYRNRLQAYATAEPVTVTVGNDVRRAVRDMEAAVTAQLLAQLATKTLKLEGKPTLWDGDECSLPMSLQAAAQRVVAEATGDWDAQGVEAQMMKAMNTLRRDAGVY